MNVNLDLYYIFYVVANSGSISKAAEVLYITQPAVTLQIKKLEDQLEICLFTRTKQGVKLTEEGSVLYEYVKKGIESIINGENALTNLKKSETGIIRIGASTTVCKHVVMPYLEKFHEIYPNIEIQIVNNLTANLLTELRNGNLDMLVLNMPMAEAKDLKVEKAKEVQDIFIGNQKYFEETKGKIKLKDLNNYPLIFQKLPSNTRTILNNYLKNNNVELKPQLEVVSYNLIMELVSAGFGIGYATKEFIQTELENKTLFEIKVTPDIPKRFIGIVTLNNKTANYSVNRLIEMITDGNDI